MPLPRRFPRRTRARALAAGLALASAALAARAESDLPFSPPWRAEIDARFFAGDELDAARLAAYREQIQQRRDEIAALLTASYREKGRKPRAIAKRLARKKVLELYDLLLGNEKRLGLLDQLWDETDATRARAIASDVLEIDYALRVEGEIPFSLRLVGYLTWASIRHWVIEPGSDPDRTALEATNLWNPQTGRFYDADDLRAIALAGGDLSRLDPPPDARFRAVGLPIAKRSVRAMFYGGNTPMHQGRPARFPERRAQLSKIRKSQTKPKFELEVFQGRKRVAYKLKVGGEIHSEPTVNALLATLGFNVDVTRYVRDFRLDLGDIDVADLRNDWRSYFENHRTHLRYDFDDYFVEGSDEDGRFLIVREGVLEWKPRYLDRIGPWPFGANGNEGRREVRALGLFSAWVGNTDLKEAENNKLVVPSPSPERPHLYALQHDLGHSLGRMVSEQLRAFPWQLVERTATGRIHLNYHAVQPNSLRTMITWADARWMTREIAQLTRRQIAQAVAIGQWPRSAAELLTEKLIDRRNQMVEAFELVGEETPSGPIALIPVDRHLTTDDGAVVDGELVDGAYEHSTQDFANYWEALLGPVWDRIAITLLAQVQRSVSQISELVFDQRSVGLSRGVVAELLLDFDRRVEENRAPTSARDYYITRDTLALGARVGGGVVGRGEAALLRKYTLVTPSGTEGEAQLARGRFLDLLLPWHVRRGELPAEYVLVREDFLEARGRAITDDLTGGAAPAGAEATLSRVRVARDVVSVRGGRVRAYRDTSVFDRAAFRAFLKAVFVRIPLVDLGSRWGERDGDYWVLDEALETAPEAARAALADFVRTGDARGLDAVADRLAVANDFAYRDDRVGLIDLVWHESGAARELVRVSDPLAGGPPVATFDQLRVFGQGHWSFLDFAETHHWAVSAVAPTDETLARDGEAATPRFALRYAENDRNTTSRELGDAYIAFANGVAGAGRDDDGPEHRAKIAFTPRLHSTNDVWGHVLATVDVGLDGSAVDALVALRPDAFWAALARELGTSVDAIEARRRVAEATGKERMTRARALAPRHRGPLDVALLRAGRRLLQSLARAREATGPAERYRAVAEALGHAAPRRDGGFDPRILAALRSLLGAEAVSVDARVTQPVWREKRLVEGEDLVLHTHAEPHSLPQHLVLFRPRDSVQIYDMLESFDVLDDAVQRARGAPPRERRAEHRRTGADDEADDGPDDGPNEEDDE